jgi:hypothetical protein
MVLDGIKALGLIGRAELHSLSSDYRLPTSSVLKLLENNPTFYVLRLPF